MLDAPVNKEKAVWARRAAELPSPQINAPTPGQACRFFSYRLPWRWRNLGVPKEKCCPLIVLQLSFSRRETLFVRDVHS